MRKLEKLGKIEKLGKLGLALLTADFLAGCGLYNYAFSRKPAIKWELGPLIKESTWIKDNCKDIYMTSSDGLLLHAYLKSCPARKPATQTEPADNAVSEAAANLAENAASEPDAKPADNAANEAGNEPATKSKYVVLCHGYRADANLNGLVAKEFLKKGYGILAPDARGHGSSEGKYIGMGWPERRDIVEWCKLLLEIDPDADIVLYGISMGAATVMCASGESDLPENVRCIIEDCGYTSTYDEIMHEMKTFHVPGPFRKPLMLSLRVATRIFAGYDMCEGGAITQLPKNKTPMLFIHGEADTFVPYRMLDENFSACAAEKQRASMPGSKHGVSILDYPEKYREIISDFTDKWVK